MCVSIPTTCLSIPAIVENSFETKLDDVMLVVCAGGRLDTYTAIRQN